tara:strand:+ start:72 stop:788 length:717 start_codon:yes stop_codon:yes gene_type:complete
MDLQLKQLISLQDVDSKIIEINSMAGDLPERVESKEKKINDLNLEIQNKNSKIEELEKEIRKLNAENEDSQIKLDKHKSQLFLVKSNKEYDALNEEIDYLKTSLSESEDKFLSLETEKDELSDAKKIDETEIESLKEKLIKEQELLNKTMSDSELELNSLNTKRKGIVKDISDNHLSLYNKLKDALGMGIAPLNGGCCGNCFSMLPPQMVIEIKSNQIIHSCPSCSVMAFWREEMEED